MAKRKYMSKVDGKINIGEKHQAKIPDLIVSEENVQENKNNIIDTTSEVVDVPKNLTKRAKVEEVPKQVEENATTEIVNESENKAGPKEDIKEETKEEAKEETKEEAKEETKEETKE
ncbi:hypothetical protein PBK173_000515500, partial [Plasmodium berghei]